MDLCLENSVCVLEIHTLEECDSIKELLRFARLFKKEYEIHFGKSPHDPTEFVKLQKIIDKNNRNIKYMNEYFNDREQFLDKYSISRILRRKYKENREEKARQKAIQENRERNGGLFKPDSGRFLGQDYKVNPEYVRPNRLVADQEPTARELEIRSKRLLRQLNSELEKEKDNGKD
jgi:hypothetical protein